MNCAKEVRTVKNVHTISTDGQKFQCSAEIHFKSILMLGGGLTCIGGLGHSGSQPSIIHVHTQPLLTCRMTGMVTYGLFMASIECWNNCCYSCCYPRRYTMASWRWCDVLWLLLALSSVCRAREGKVQIASNASFLFLDFVSQQISFSSKAARQDLKWRALV